MSDLFARIYDRLLGREHIPPHLVWVPPPEESLLPQSQWQRSPSPGHDPMGAIVPSVEEADLLPISSYMAARVAAEREELRWARAKTVRSISSSVVAATLDAAGVAAERVGHTTPQDEDVPPSSSEDESLSSGNESAKPPPPQQQQRPADYVTPEQPEAESLTPADDATDSEESDGGEYDPLDPIRGPNFIEPPPTIPESLRRVTPPTWDEIRYPFGPPEQRELSEDAQARVEEWLSSEEETDRQERRTERKFGGRKKYWKARAASKNIGWLKKHSDARLHDPPTPTPMGQDEMSRQLYAEQAAAQAWARERVARATGLEKMKQGAEYRAKQARTQTPEPQHYGLRDFLSDRKFDDMDELINYTRQLYPTNPQAQCYLERLSQWHAQAHPDDVASPRRLPDWQQENWCWVERWRDETAQEHLERLLREGMMQEAERGDGPLQVDVRLWIQQREAQLNRPIINRALLPLAFNTLERERNVEAQRRNDGRADRRHRLEQVLSLTEPSAEGYGASAVASDHTLTEDNPPASPNTVAAAAFRVQRLRAHLSAATQARLQFHAAAVRATYPGVAAPVAELQDALSDQTRIRLWRALNQVQQADNGAGEEEKENRKRKRGADGEDGAGDPWGGALPPSPPAPPPRQSPRTPC